MVRYHFKYDVGRNLAKLATMPSDWRVGMWNKQSGVYVPMSLSMPKFQSRYSARAPFLAHRPAKRPDSAATRCCFPRRISLQFLQAAVFTPFQSARTSKLFFVVCVLRTSAPPVCQHFLSSPPRSHSKMQNIITVIAVDSA